MSEITEKLQELLSKATPGPWVAAREVAIDYRPMQIIGADRKSSVAFMCGGGPIRAVDGPEERANAQLIATLRNHAPALLAAAKERDVVRAALGCDDKWTPEAVAFHAKKLHAAPTLYMCSQCETMHNAKQDCRVCEANNATRKAESRLALAEELMGEVKRKAEYELGSGLREIVQRWEASDA